MYEKTSSSAAVYRGDCRSAGDAALAADTDSLPAKQGDFYVMVNGEYVTFPDAVPQIRESRSCLPFVAVFDQLGFPEENMTWDASTGTVTAVKPDVVYTSFQGDTKQGDLTVQLTIGSNDISYWYEGNTTAGPTEIRPRWWIISRAKWPPTSLTAATYIPFGLLADALGYNVGWMPRLGRSSLMTWTPSWPPTPRPMS